MSYNKTNWNSGDVITAEKLNNIEKGIEDASSDSGSGGSSSGRVIELFVNIIPGQDGFEIGGQTDAGLTIKDLASSFYLISEEGESLSVVSTLAAIKNNTTNIHEIYIKLGNVTQSIYYIVDTGEITNATPQASTS